MPLSRAEFFSPPPELHRSPRTAANCLLSELPLTENGNILLPLIVIVVVVVAAGGLVLLLEV